MGRKRNSPAKLLGRETITRADYPGVFGDTDRDKLPDADDPHPQHPGDTESIEEVQLADELGSLIDTRKGYVDVMRAVKKDLQDLGISGSKVKGRVKTPYSILNKLRRKRLGTLTDIAGTMLVVPDQNTVEKARKAIERSYEVLDFDDYYASPLGGGYRAYHFVIDKDGTPVEVQLKTERMSKIADASHTAYKKGELDEDVLESLTTLAMKADNGDQKAAAEIDKILKSPKRLTMMLITDKYDALTLDNPGELPEDPWRYFTRTNGAKLVPVSALEPIRSRSTRNAQRHMQRAYEGKGPKRKPIVVRAIGGGRYEVVDGNATYAVAKSSGWKRIPVEIERAANPAGPTESDLIRRLRF